MKHPSPVRLALLVLSLSYFAMGVAALAIVGALPAIAQGLHASRADLANAVAVFAITFAIAAPAAQIFLSRVPRGRLLICGLVLMGAGTVLSALSSAAPMFLLARIVAALGAAAVGPVASAVGASLVGREQQGRALATVFSGMTLASVLGVPLSAWLADQWGYRPMLLAVAAFAFVAAGLVARNVHDAEKGSAMTLRMFMDVIANRAVALGIAVMALEMAGVFGTYTMISPMLRERFHASAMQVSLALFALGLAGVAGNTLARRVGDLWSADRTVAIALASLATAFGILYFAPSVLPVAIAMIVLWAIASDLFMPAQQRRLVELAAQSRGLALALNSSAIYVGMAAGSFVSGRVYAATGTGPLPLITALILLCALLALWRSRRAHARQLPPARPGCASLVPESAAQGH